MRIKENHLQLWMSDRALTCDSKIAVTLLSPRAVTRLNVCNQMIMYQCVTDDR
ncbi:MULTISPECIES: hypothetical protein [Bacteroides]|uniref:hypothetical protein n=1 Tax=Bacteroides TaxID=816 RepID=UPI001C3E0CDC|nr:MULTISPECIES: hypothetical protein [Bacteroides]